MTMSHIQRNLLLSLFAAFVMLFSFNAVGMFSVDTADANALINPTPIPEDPTGGGSGPAKTLMQKMLNAAKIFAGFVLAASVIVIVYGGLKYVLSQGDSKAAEQGKMLIIYSGIGIFVALSAFVIIKMFIGFAV